jgi:hypothetical protein
MRPKYICAIAGRYSTNSYSMSLENSGPFLILQEQPPLGFSSFMLTYVQRNVLGILNSFWAFLNPNLPFLIAATALIILSWFQYFNSCFSDMWKENESLEVYERMWWISRNRKHSATCLSWKCSFTLNYFWRWCSFMDWAISSQTELSKWSAIRWGHLPQWRVKLLWVLEEIQLSGESDPRARLWGLQWQTLVCNILPWMAAMFILENLSLSIAGV